MRTLFLHDLALDRPLLALTHFPDGDNWSTFLRAGGDDGIGRVCGELDRLFRSGLEQEQGFAALRPLASRNHLPPI